MDGTFLDSKGQFDMDRLKQVLARFKEKGMYFAVASGRALLSLEKLFEEVRNEIILLLKTAVWWNFMERISMRQPCQGIFISRFLISCRNLPMSMSTSCF